MKLAIQLNDVELIKDIFVSCTGRYYDPVIHYSVYYRGMPECKIILYEPQKEFGYCTDNVTCC